MDSDDEKSATAPINDNRNILRDDGLGASQRERDKLRRRNSVKGSGWTSSVHVPTSDIPMNSKSRNMARQSSNVLPGQTSDPDITAVPDGVSSGLVLVPRSASRRLHREQNFGEDNSKEEEEEENEDIGGGWGEEGKEEQEPAKMSLMSLLAESDEDIGSGGLAYMMEGDDDDEDEDEEGSGAGAFNSCCVCMVKHKGTAFHPCGHSFCRLCSREMWVEKSNCPLCNNYVLEILDVF